MNRLMVQRQNPTFRQSVPIVVVLIVVGIALVAYSLASGPFALNETENSVLSNGAKVIAISGASGGNVVQFNSVPVSTPTPVPTQAPTPIPAPVRPSAANTGVPAGTALTAYNGNMIITTAGTVIDKMDIHGYVSIKAPNVTIKRSIVRGDKCTSGSNGGDIRNYTAGATNFLIEDVTIRPEFPDVCHDGIKVNQSGTINRVNLSGTVDGVVMFGNNITLQNSYLHDFVTYPSDPAQGGGPSHSDTIMVQSGTGERIINNSLTGANNSAVMITQDAGITGNLWISSNWIDGGACSLNYGSGGAYKTGLQANNNRFGRSQGISGCAIIHNALKSDLVPSGNVWDDTGLPAGIKAGA